MRDSHQAGSGDGVSELIGALQEHCEKQTFAPGDVLRSMGQHYRNMYVVLRGQCAVQLKSGDPRDKWILRGPGQPIGEIGFLRGTAANADVTAQENMSALVIDDDTMERVERDKPELLATLLQRLSEIADDRSSYNLTLPDGEEVLDEASSDVEVLLCRNADMLRQAQKLRYDVYCTELQRKSPFADHNEKIITDPLDAFGHCFIAVKDGKTIGTLRSNSPLEGEIGSLEQLYGMHRSEHHPQATSVTTKFIVVREMRRSPVAMQLISYASQYGLNFGVIESFIDCVPKLSHYYRAMGFAPAEKPFLHPENGPSIPMRINLEKNAKTLIGDVGLSRMITFYAKAKAYKIAGHLRG